MTPFGQPKLGDAYERRVDVSAHNSDQCGYRNHANARKNTCHGAMTAMSLAELSGEGLLRGWEHQGHRLLRAGMAYLMANQSSTQRICENNEANF